MLEKTGVPPAIIEIYDSDRGALVGYPVYSDGDQEKLIKYQLLVRLPYTQYANAFIYFCYDFSTRRTICLVFGDHLDQLQHRFQQLVPGEPSTSSARPQQYPRDPFVTLSTIAADYATVIAFEYRKLCVTVSKQEDETGVQAHLFDQAMPFKPSALPLRIKGLHVGDGRLVYFLYTLESQIKWVAFLQRQHLIVNELRRKAMLDGADRNEDRRRNIESVASRKVAVSLDLSIYIRVAQNQISQFDSRTNISIAYDSKRIASDARKDNVAMKTIAGLTMVFLPGTFTATFFSMVFFHVTDGPGPRLTVNEHWWLYIAVTVPLIGLVLAAWLGWLKWKRRAMPKDAELEDFILE